MNSYSRRKTGHCDLARARRRLRERLAMRRDPWRDELSINGLPSARNKIEKYAMPAKTASFDAEFPLRTTQADERALAIRRARARRTGDITVNHPWPKG